MAENSTLWTWGNQQKYHEELQADIDSKISTGGSVVDDALSDTSENPVQNKVITEALNDKANKDEIPTSLPANGGNAATVNGLTVKTAVPENAKFTDTVYTHPSGTEKTGNPTANQTPAFGGTFTTTQFTTNATGHVVSATDRTVKIPNTAASANAAGLVNTGAQTFAGNKSFNGVVDFNGASAVGTAQGRNIYAGTTDLEAGVSALETGTIYIVYE